MTNNADAQIAREWASKALENDLLDEVPLEGYRAAARHILATTTPPTMADMSPEEREACQWMQATFTKSPHEHIITQVFVKKARLLRRSDGAMFEFHHDEVIPHPDLPRLEWPASEPVTEDTPEPEPESTPDHPTELTIEADYRNAPTGTIVATEGAEAWTKDLDGLWETWGIIRGYSNYAMADEARQVLRWGWKA